MTDDGDSLEQDFDVLVARAGLVVPAEWRAGTLAGYAELRAMAELLHAPRPAEAEPANVYRPPSAP